MALAGPAASLAIGAVLLAAHQIADGLPADLRMGLFYLGYLNIVLGVFNLLPAFPMDGGRILRAMLSVRLGPARATYVAAKVGRFVAVMMGLAGLWSGNFLLLMIAIFVYYGAGAEAAGARRREALGGLRIAELVPMIRRPPRTISHVASLSDVLPRMHEAGRLDLIVTDLEGAPVNVLQAADLAQIAAEERKRLNVQDLVSRFGPRHVVVPWDANANDVLEQAAEKNAPFVIVTDPTLASAHGLVGLLSAADIETMIELRLAEPRSPWVAPGRSGLGERHPNVVPPHSASGR